jgi:excisionase family DNA binding protein
MLLRIEEAAEVLALGRSKTYALVQAGVLPSIRLGRSVRVPAKALEAWAAEQLQTDAQK